MANEGLHFPFRPYPNTLHTGFSGDPLYIDNAVNLLNYVQHNRPEHTLFVLGSFQDEFDDSAHSSSSSSSTTSTKSTPQFFANQTDTLLPVFLMNHYDHVLRKSSPTGQPQTLEIVLVAPSKRLRDRPPYMLEHKKMSPFEMTPEDDYSELHMYLYGIFSESHDFADVFDLYEYGYGEDEYSPYYEIKLVMKEDIPDGEMFHNPLNAIIRFRWFYTMWIDCVRDDYVLWNFVESDDGQWFTAPDHEDHSSTNHIYLPKQFRGHLPEESSLVPVRDEIQTHMKQVYATEDDFQFSATFQQALTEYVAQSSVIVLNYAVFLSSDRRNDLYYLEHSIPPLDKDRIITYYHYPIYSSGFSYFVNGKQFYTLSRKMRNEYKLLANGKQDHSVRKSGLRGLSHFFGKELGRLMKGGRRRRQNRQHTMRKKKWTTNRRKSKKTTKTRTPRPSRLSKKKKHTRKRKQRNHMMR